MCRITIFAGHYGSGKTTAAVAFAKKMNEIRLKQALQGEQALTAEQTLQIEKEMQVEKALPTEQALKIEQALQIKQALPVTIVDIDLVNPYYRTKDAKDALEKLGIKVISPSFANTNAEAPSLPSEVMAAFDNKGRKIIFDVGGDDDGGIVLGRYFVNFAQEKYDFLLVINTKRPLTCDAKSIIMYMNDIERASRLKFTGLVNATNIALETKVSDILESEKIISEVSSITGLEKKYNFVLPQLYDELPLELQKTAITVELFNIKPWEM